jgi:opacity protein-like surface antigen
MPSGSNGDARQSDSITKKLGSVLDGTNENFVGANSQGRIAFLYGAGADFSVTKRIFVRPQYRGLVFNSPTFDIPMNLGADRNTHQAEPSIGFGYRF